MSTKYNTKYKIGTSLTNIELDGNEGAIGLKIKCLEISTNSRFNKGDIVKCVKLSYGDGYIRVKKHNNGRSDYIYRNEIWEVVGYE